MGSRRSWGARSRERARASFLIVVMFFAVFALIILTELLLVEPTEPKHQLVQPKDRPDYDLQNDDYLNLRVIGGSYNGESKSKNGKDFPASFEDHLPPPPSNGTPPDAVWQPVGGTRYKFLIYSAYYEQRGGRFIRIIGATKTRGAERVWCRLWYEGNKSATVLAKVKMIRENWNLKYSACFVICSLKRNQTAPVSISVVARPRAYPMNIVKVRAPPQDVTVAPDSLAICIKPLHFTYNRHMQLLEFIELNLLMGATHFIMYNHTVGEQAGCILNHYIKKGILSLHPWQLNMLSQKEIRTEGLFAALNDCLYRSMYHYAYTALIDLDEFIIPRKSRTLPDMLASLGARSDSRSAGAFSFQNAFFYLQWPDELPKLGDTRITSSLITQKKTRRRQKLHPHKQRSKYICKPERVYEAGNHFVWEFVPGSGALSVPPDYAILHHYRVCEFGGDDCVKTPSFLDRTAMKFKEELTDVMEKKYDELYKECKLPSLPSFTAQTVAPAAPLSPPV